jgi:hypothetical protein
MERGKRLPDTRDDRYQYPWRRHYESNGTGEFVKSAVLVKTVRTPAGPRHKHICYIGTIREAEINHYGHRVEFWISVEKNLDAAGIVGEERQTIEAALSAVVEKPDEAAIRKEQRRRKRLDHR